MRLLGRRRRRKTLPSITKTCWERRSSCVFAPTAPDAARRAEHRVLTEIDRLAVDLQWVRSGAASSRAGRPRRRSPSRSRPSSTKFSRRATLGNAQPRSIRPQGRGAVAALDALRPDRGRLPTDQETNASKALLEAPAWRLDPVARHGRASVGLPDQSQRNRQGIISSSGLRCRVRARLPASRELLLNVGGDLRVRGQTGRTIGIAAPWADSESSEPDRFIEVENRSVATSGKSRRGFQIDGKWYSHVFDPRSARPVERVIGATVVADEEPTPTPWPRSAACSSPKKASGWSIHCRTSNA